MAIMANTDTVAPPSTQEGTVVSRAENLGISPASTIITAASPRTTRFTTFVMMTIPTFWLKVAVGSPPKRESMILMIPFPMMPPDISSD